MSADQFAMEPAATLDGLTAAAGDRLGACAQGLPTIPAGTYTAAFATALTTTLTAHLAAVGAQAANGAATAAASVAATESSNESTAATILST